MNLSAKLSVFLSVFTVLCISCSSTPEISNPAGPESQLPYLTADSNGTVFMSWVEPTPAENEFALLYSILQNGQWSTPEMIARSNSWFVNWADYPSVTAKNGQPVAAHWLHKIPGSAYSYNVNLSMKQRGDWSDVITPHADSTATEHGFVSMIPRDQNSVLAIWLDGRQTHNRTDEEYFDLSKAMTLRSAVINSDGEVSTKREIDNNVCDCCNTSLAATGDGAIAAYRDRTEEEIRDIYVSRFQNGSWSDPVAVHEDGWEIAACPVNGPQIAVRDSTATVAWYTGADDRQQVKVAFSDDLGANFSDPIVLNNAKAIGRTDIAMFRDGTTYVSWLEENQDRAALKVSTISSAYEIVETRTVSLMSKSRTSGFPQMVIGQEELIFAWTDVAEDGSISSIKTTALPF